MTHIQQRRGTAAAWTTENPILMEGEAGHETDTGRWKLGDGITPWDDLSYKSGVDSVAGKTGVVALVVGDVTGAAPTASPVFTGSPKAPTKSKGDSSTNLATTAYVKSQFDDTDLTGTPTAPTPAVDDDDESIATTEFVTRAVENTRTTVAAANYKSQIPIDVDVPSGERLITQASTMVGSTNGVGIVFFNYPFPFPDAVISVVCSADTASGAVTAQPQQSSSSKSTLGVVVRDENGDPLLSTAVRISYIAIGF